MTVILEALAGFIRWFFSELVWSGIGELCFNIASLVKENKRKNIGDETE